MAAERRSQMAAERRSTASRSSNLLDLPPDILLQILTLLRSNYDRLISLSLVCKSFRFLTNQLVHKLTFNVNRMPSASALRKLLSIFPAVKQFGIRTTRIDHALDLVDRSGIKTECLEICENPKTGQIVVSLLGSVGEFRSLKLGLSVVAFDSDCLIHLFPYLEELNFNAFGYCNWSDEWILKLAVNCRNLRKVNLDYSYSVTARALDALAVCCVDLERISIVGCRKLSFQNVMDFMQKVKKLKSLELPRYLFSYNQVLPALTFANSEPVCESLSHLSIDGGLLKDDFLLAIAGIRAPLISLELKLLQMQHPTYTTTGLSVMLRAFPMLTRLILHLPWPGSDAQDKKLSQLVKSLTCLKYVSFVTWYPVCSTLFSLIDNCSLLECVFIKCWDYYTPWKTTHGIKRNYSIQRIDIDPWPHTLSKMDLKLLCPSLKPLQMSSNK